MSGNDQNDETATFGTQSATADSTEMAMVGRAVDSVPSTLTNGSPASSESALYTLMNPNRTLPLSSLPPVPASDGGSNGSRGRAPVVGNAEQGRPGRNRSRSNTPRPPIPDGGSERSVRSSNKSLGRVRPSGYTEIIAEPDRRSPDEKLEALLAEHNAVQKFKADMVAKRTRIAGTINSWIAVCGKYLARVIRVWSSVRWSRSATKGLYLRARKSGRETRLSCLKSRTFVCAWGSGRETRRLSTKNGHSKTIVCVWKWVCTTYCQTRFSRCPYE